MAKSPASQMRDAELEKSQISIKNDYKDSFTAKGDNYF